MKKILFLLTVFFFTTGFFKSTLEKCSDYQFRISNSLPKAEYKIVKLSKAEYQRKIEAWQEDKKHWAEMSERNRKKWEKKPFCTKANLNKKNCRMAYDTFPIFFFPETYPKDTVSIKIRDYSEREIKRNQDKFLRQSLKKKLRLADQNKIGGKTYLNHYKKCVKSKENNSQLFEDKYN